jgi:hypothetical protein
LPLFSEIADQIDPSLMWLIPKEYFKPSVKEAPLSSHGDASMRHVQEKDAPLVNQGSRRLRTFRTEFTMMAPLRLAVLQSQRR